MYRVELENISKSFGGIPALKNVTLKVRAGEIHALVGENGAGKSTLMKILSGAYIKDAGEILVDGKVARISNTHDSKKYGIGIIYQEFSLVPDLSVAENIFLSKLNTTGFWMKWARLKSKADKLISSIGYSINPATKVRKLSIAHQQIVEIAKALSEDVKILILDEPSTVLGPLEIESLFETLNKLKIDGVSIIYISHHLSEVFRIADRVTVLKDGASGESMAISDTDKDSIIRLMLGRSLDAMYPERTSSIGNEVLKAEEIHLIDDDTKGQSLYVKEGEVLGIAGLVGSGRTETVQCLFGTDKLGKGKLFLYGKQTQINSPGRAVKNGIGMVPEDRKQQGIIPGLSIKENIGLTSYDMYSNRLGFIQASKERKFVNELISKLSIKTIDENTKVTFLSGGNQQKVALAKWMSGNSRVMIIDEPTRGVDIGAKVEIYNLINELSAKGVAVIVVSSETSELMGICDRVLVMRKYKIQGELMKKDFSEENILRLAMGT